MVFAFFSKTIEPTFSSGFRRKHMFITTCIEKHCTWSLIIKYCFFSLYLYVALILQMQLKGN